ncbi:MAG: GNAT family N-acetyltransferase [Gaiellaceae bacterium]
MRLAFPDPPLAGEGILLRALRGEDAAWIAAACDTAEMSRWLPQIPSPYSEADAHAFIERSALVWQDGTHAPFVVAGEGDTPLGLVELRLLPGSDAVAELGYWLRPEARGLGAMTKAVLLVAGWAFGTLGLRRLQLTADPENHASQRVAERAGFTREGVLRSWLMTRVGRRDAVMFSLLPEDRSG